ncbi:hypothetical protein P4E94_01055 [Pontiellaceae bacterium B12219]|nr:hypothetical protein [Pontiellaceae bacterium B12219]
MKLASILILLFCASVHADFDAMVAVTRQDPSMDWWYAVPGEFTPKISTVSSVTKDEYFRIIPFFNKYGIDSNRAAHISFDVEVIRPDGSIDISMSDCEGYSGPVKSKTLLPAQAILNMCFDPEDPYGDYRIRVTSVDHVSNETLIQEESITLKEMTLEKLTASERDQLFFNYATAPDPSRAFAAFLETEHSFFNEESEPIWSAIWFFKTIFENNPYLLPHLQEIYPAGTRKQKRDIILLLSLLGQSELLPRISSDLKTYQRGVEAGRIPNPYDEITTGKQLDMLWAEFFATGTVKPIEQIISALQLVEHLGTLDKIKAGELDIDELEVYRAGMLEAVFQSALWSLKSNCRECPLVFQYAVGILNSGKLEKPVQSCLGMLLKSIANESESQPKENL